MNYFIKLLKMFFGDRSSLIFLGAVLLGLSFSISIIISASGLMEGFKLSLTSSLQQNRGDLIVSGRRRFFKPQEVENRLKELGVDHYTSIVLSESFLIANEESQGVLVKGIDASYNMVAHISKVPKRQEIIIGKELADKLAITIGDEIALMFAAGSKQLAGTPILENFKVVSIITPQIYQESLRVVYVNKQRLQQTLGLRNRVNQSLLQLPKSVGTIDNGSISAFQQLVANTLGYEFQVQTFWEKYKGLLEAVRIEEFYIVAILQVIVLVSIFNIVALLFFVTEKKMAQVFLLQVLGMGQKQLRLFWYTTIILLWLIAISGSLFLSGIYRYILANWDIFKVPGSVYHLSRFIISFNVGEICVVFLLVLFMMLMITWWSMHRRDRGSLITKMRQL